MAGSNQALVLSAPSPRSEDGDDQARDVLGLLDNLKRENEALKQELEQLKAYRTLAYRDPLTGLWNRRYFDERLSEEVERARRCPTHEFAVMVIDLDRFKSVNDRYGHPAGDRTLQWVASFLRRTLREHDICCRTGGDEFTVVLPFAGRREAAVIEQRVRLRLGQANRRIPIPVEMSIGLAAYPTDGEDSASLFGHADSAMYANKQARSAQAER